MRPSPAPVESDGISLAAVVAGVRYAARDPVLLGTYVTDMIAMVFAFGLIHGFGLSTRLQQLPLGEDRLEAVPYTPFCQACASGP